jgi:hypothetical protein
LLLSTTSSYLTSYLDCSRESLFPSHLSLEEMTRGIKNKKFYRGVLRCRGGGRLGYDDCYLVVHQEMTVGGKKKVNRWSVSLKGERTALLESVLTSSSVLSSRPCPLFSSPLLSGRERINRALDGDIVAVEILTGEELETEKTKKTIQAHPSETNETSVVVVAEETAVPSAADLEGLQKQPSGGDCGMPHLSCRPE